MNTQGSEQTSSGSSLVLVARFYPQRDSVRNVALFPVPACYSRQGEASDSSSHDALATAVLISSPGLARAKQQHSLTYPTRSAPSKEDEREDPGLCTRLESGAFHDLDISLCTSGKKGAGTTVQLGWQRCVGIEAARAHHMTGPYQKLMAPSSPRRSWQRKSAAGLVGRVHRFGRWPHGA